MIFIGAPCSANIARAEGPKSFRFRLDNLLRYCVWKRNCSAAGRLKSSWHIKNLLWQLRICRLLETYIFLTFPTCRWGWRSWRSQCDLAISDARKKSYTSTATFLGTKIEITWNHQIFFHGPTKMPLVLGHSDLGLHHTTAASGGYQHALPGRLGRLWAGVGHLGSDWVVTENPRVYRVDPPNMFDRIELILEVGIASKIQGSRKWKEAQIKEFWTFFVAESWHRLEKRVSGPLGLQMVGWPFWGDHFIEAALLDSGRAV